MGACVSLRARQHGEVRPQFERPLVVGGRERVVDHHLHAHAHVHRDGCLRGGGRAGLSPAACVSVLFSRLFRSHVLSCVCACVEECAIFSVRGVGRAGGCTIFDVGRFEVGVVMRAP